MIYVATVHKMQRDYLTMLAFPLFYTDYKFKATVHYNEKKETRVSVLPLTLKLFSVATCFM